MQPIHTERYLKTQRNEQLMQPIHTERYLKTQRNEQLMQPIHTERYLKTQRNEQLMQLTHTERYLKTQRNEQLMHEQKMIWQCEIQGGSNTQYKFNIFTIHKLLKPRLQQSKIQLGLGLETRSTT